MSIAFVCNNRSHAKKQKPQTVLFFDQPTSTCTPTKQHYSLFCPSLLTSSFYTEYRGLKRRQVGFRTLKRMHRLRIPATVTVVHPRVMTCTTIGHHPRCCGCGCTLAFRVVERTALVVGRMERAVGCCTFLKDGCTVGTRVFSGVPKGCP